MVSESRELRNKKDGICFKKKNNTSGYKKWDKVEEMRDF